jgi:nucleotide-binding universal stress UspA family protein
MTLRKIMIPFVETGTCDAAFEAGLVLARHFEAHLDAVHSRPRIVMPAGLYYPAIVPYIESNYDALSEAVTRAARELKSRFDALCGKHKLSVLDSDTEALEPGLSASWDEYEARSVYDLSDRARLRDLTMMARPSDVDRRDVYGLMEAILFGSGRPLMVLGSKTKLKRVPSSIVLAWNGSREASRAMAAAHPLLAAAKSVSVVTVGEAPDGDLSAGHAAAYLRLHGISARARHVERGTFERAEDAMMDLVEAETPDLVVLGAYSHSRLQQMVLGGFTRHLLHDAPCPVLLAH